MKVSSNGEVYRRNAVGGTAGKMQDDTRKAVRKEGQHPQDEQRSRSCFAAVDFGTAALMHKHDTSEVLNFIKRTQSRRARAHFRIPSFLFPYFHSASFRQMKARVFEPTNSDNRENSRNCRVTDKMGSTKRFVTSGRARHGMGDISVNALLGLHAHRIQREKAS